MSSAAERPPAHHPAERSPKPEPAAGNGDAGGSPPRDPAAPDGGPSDAAERERALSRAQLVAERVHGAPPAPPVVYEGLVTRAIAFALDAAIIDLIGLAVGAAVALGLSVLSLHGGVHTAVIAIGGVVFAIWTVGYFVVFWSSTGQTPGNRVLRIRVRRADEDAALRPSRALLRFGALVLATIPLGAGLVPILLNDRRRGLQDVLADTVVVSADEPVS